MNGLSQSLKKGAGRIALISVVIGSHTARKLMHSMRAGAAGQYVQQSIINRL
jgi:hypothetical protein